MGGTLLRVRRALRGVRRAQPLKMHGGRCGLSVFLSALLLSITPSDGAHLRAECWKRTAHPSILKLRGGASKRSKLEEEPEPSVSPSFVSRVAAFAIMPTVARLSFAAATRKPPPSAPEPTTLQSLFTPKGFSYPTTPPSMPSLPYPAGWQMALALAWAANNIAVAVPGRYDGRSAMRDERVDASTTNLFSPAGFAFAIWAPIFIGEWLMMLYLTNVPRAAALGRIVAPGWIAGTVAQTLWCGAFRPSVCGPSMLWVPTLLLATTGACLGVAHRALRATSIGALSNVLVRWPLTLHFGWISCAALVNLNNWLARIRADVRVKEMASHASAIAAVAAAVYVSMTTGDPIFAGVITWALVAVAIDGNRAARGLVADAVLDRTGVSARIGAGLAALFMTACALNVVGPKSGWLWSP